MLAVTPFDSEDEAIALANGTDYGLGGYIHTQNLRRAHHVAGQLDAGMIHVNGSGEGMTPCAPFGGMKQSGYGRLGGEEGLHEFLRVKNVWMNLAKPAAVPGDAARSAGATARVRSSRPNYRRTRFGARTFARSVMARLCLCRSVGAPGSRFAVAFSRSR